MNQLFPALPVNCCSLHSIRVRTATTGHSRQRTATTACKISLRNEEIAESHQTGFTLRRNKLKYCSSSTADQENAKRVVDG